jgi:hypothetical protein
MWIQNTHIAPELCPDDLNRRAEIRIVRDDHGKVIIGIEAITKEIACQVDVGPFLFRVQDLNSGGRATTRMRERASLGLRQEVAVMNGEVWDSRECPQVDLLVESLIRFASTGLYQRRKVPNPVYRRTADQEPAESVKIEPFAGNALSRMLADTVEEVEPVNIDVDSHRFSVNG